MNGEHKHILNFYIFLPLIVLLFCNTVFAQSIEGVVITEQNSAVGNVSVILKNSEDKTIAYQFTKPDGSFSFANLDSKKYTLQCNALGYEKQLLTIDLSNEKTKKVTVTLNEKTEELQEIVIDILAPIKQKNDTITFDVKSFSSN